jgi:murein L,D-transpeptidase YcbB/YkuD
MMVRRDGLRRLVLLASMGVGAFGCAHATVGGDAPPAQGETKPEAAAPEKPHEARTPSETPVGPHDPLPVFTTPGAALKPGAVEKIQDKLSMQKSAQEHPPPQGDEAGALDDHTREALRAFQKDHGVPATGLPDDATIKLLGLDPADIFRAEGKKAP